MRSRISIRPRRRARRSRRPRLATRPRQAEPAKPHLKTFCSIPSSQLPAIYEAFGKAKLSGYEIDANHRIRVPGSQKAIYMAALADANALPRGFGEHMIDAIKSVGPFGSQKQQNELIKTAKEQTLAEIIS